MNAGSTRLGYAGIGLLAGILSAGVTAYSWWGIEKAKVNYIERSAVEAARGAERANEAIRDIYQNLRTLASLPSVRSIDRHGTNLSPEARTTFQHIYNNLANSVAISEVYIVPADFDPARIDSVTGRTEEPILMFDHLILNAGAGMTVTQRALNPEIISKEPLSGPEEVEIHEYRQFVDHMGWFRQNAPFVSSISGLNVPLISGPEVITCDNTEFISTGADADRAGILFSVPFYGEDSRFKGTVSAIILSNALKKLLPSSDFLLVNPGNGYVNGLTAGGHWADSMPYIEKGVVDPRLIFSRVIALTTVDQKSPWLVWAGHDDGAFYGGPEFRAVRIMQFAGYGIIAALALAGCLCWHLLLRNLRDAEEKSAGLTSARDSARQAAENAQRAEQEALEMAKSLQALNNDVTRLNIELAGKIRQLHDAQEDIVRKGKMAQLGQLTATVAHELRNPLAAVRTTAFVLGRKIRAAGLDLEPFLARIDAGVDRCDGIIFQLLDFTRSKTADLVLADVDHWLAEAAREEAAGLPGNVKIECNLGLVGLKAAIDPERMRRAISNLLCNACEAMVGKRGDRQAQPSSTPTISIVSRVQPRGIEISVSDNGPGMAADVLAKLREPLFTTKSFGTGLGIPIIEKIAELHGGGLDIQSRPGEGARFTIWFPVNQIEQKVA